MYTVCVLVSNSIQSLSMNGPFLQFPSRTVIVSMATGTTQLCNISRLRDFIYTG